MELPKAVREAGEKANQLIKEYAQEREGTPPETAPEPEPVKTTTETVVEPATPTETPETAAVETPPTPPEDDPNSDTWKQRFNTLSGKYNAEVPLLNEQVTYLMQQNQKLTERLENFEASRTTETKPEEKELSPPTPSPEVLDHLLDHPKIKYFKENFDEIYEATILLCGRMIRHEIDKSEKRIRDRLAADEEKTAEEEKRKFYEALRKAYPNWESIQSSLEFQAFLREPDEHWGIVRANLLKNAYDERDAPRAIRFFDLFFNPPALTDKDKAISPSNGKIGSRIAPPRPSNATPKGKENLPLNATQAREEYQKLCNRKSQGKISEADFKKEEARLHRAMRSA